MFSADLVNEKGNIPWRGVAPKFSDLEVISLSLAAESIGIDRKSLLFSKLNEYKDDFSSLISRRQYNDRRKRTNFTNPPLYIMNQTNLVKSSFIYY